MSIDFKIVEDFLKEADLTMVRYDKDHLNSFLEATGLKFDFPLVLVTGSNGKGLTTAFLEAIYRAAGYKVGSFRKPVPGSFLNMIKLDGKPIGESSFAGFFVKYQRDFARFQLSSFEIEVLVAYMYFNAEHPDIAIVECGMGGETDATNIADPLCSVITSVSLEHTSFLGRTLGEIALSKSGIMRPLVPLVTGKIPEEGFDVLHDRARALNCPILPADEVHNASIEGTTLTFDYTPYHNLKIGIPAEYAARDAGIAIEVTKALSNRFGITEEAVRKGLASTVLPGRFEARGLDIFDGAHNPEAIGRTMEAYEAFGKGKPLHVIFASFTDKNIAAILPIIEKDAASLAFTTFPHPRARVEDDYFLYTMDHPFVEDYLSYYKQLRAEHPEDYIMFTGSLAFVYKVLEELNG